MCYIEIGSPQSRGERKGFKNNYIYRFSLRPLRLCGEYSGAKKRLGNLFTLDNDNYGARESKEVTMYKIVKSVYTIRYPVLLSPSSVFRFPFVYTTHYP